MAKYKFNHMKMVAQSVIVPENEINIYDEAQYYDNNVKRIDRMRKMVGFFKRRVSDKDVAPSYYALDAARKLFAETNIEPSSVDAVVYMAQRQDWSQPSTGYYLHKKLHLSEQCPCLTINQGCPAWIYGMWTVAQMLESGANKRILLLCGDTPSVGIDPANRISAPVFGDAGCATLLEYDENATPTYFNIETFSDGFEAIITPISGAHCVFSKSDPDDIKQYNELLDTKITTPSGMKTTLFAGYMDGIAVFDFTISKVPANIKSLMNFANVSCADIDTLCLHQANKQIVQSVAIESGFDLDKAPYYAFENYGNNTMCSIPTTINTIVKNADWSGPKTLLCSGFGNGLAVATMLITLSPDVKLCGVFNWTKPDDFMTRDQYIAYWKNKIETTKH